MQVEVAATAVISLDDPAKRRQAAMHLRASLAAAEQAVGASGFDGDALIESRRELLAVAEANDWPQIDLVLADPDYRAAGSAFRLAAENESCLDDQKRGGDFAGGINEGPYSQSLPSSATVDRARGLGDAASTGSVAGHSGAQDPITRAILDKQEEAESRRLALLLVLMLCGSLGAIWRYRIWRRWGRRFVCWQPAILSNEETETEATLVALDRRRAHLRSDSGFEKGDRVALAFCGVRKRASVSRAKDGLISLYFDRRLTRTRYVSIRKVAKMNGGIGELE